MVESAPIQESLAGSPAVRSTPGHAGHPHRTPDPLGASGSPALNLRGCFHSTGCSRDALAAGRLSNLVTPPFGTDPEARYLITDAATSRGDSFLMSSRSCSIALLTLIST